MAPKGASDPRYRVNVEIGMRVMIQVDDRADLAPCYVKDIITRDPMNEAGIKVICEDGKVGRIKHIGTEASFMTSMDLISNLERKLRNIVVQELSRDDPAWWENKIPPRIKENVMLERQKDKVRKEDLQIPNYENIDSSRKFTPLSQPTDVLRRVNIFRTYGSIIYGALTHPSVSAKRWTGAP